MGRGLSIALMAVCAATAQNDPRKATDYPAHASWPKFEIGAEYLMHSIPTQKGTLFAGDYLVVEVSIYPGKTPLEISSGAFTLRLNGRKFVLNAEPPGFVAAALKYPDWEQHPTLVATAQMGDATVAVGQPPNPGRFPQDPNRDRRLPQPGHPDDAERGGIDKSIDIDQVIKFVSLPEVTTNERVKGCLYFRYSGKIKSIHTVDLEYKDGSSLRLAGH